MTTGLAIRLLDVLRRRRAWMSRGEIRRALGVDDWNLIGPALAQLQEQGVVDRQKVPGHSKELYGYHGRSVPDPDPRPR